MSLDLFERPATNDTGERQTHDYYETPLWMTATLLHHQPIDGVVFEPCAGDGAIARALESAGRTVITNDLDTRHPTTMHGDATNPRFWKHSALGAVDWIVTNPPFNVAFKILDEARPRARVGVAMLLRKTFLEPTKERGVFFSLFPPDRIIGLPRHNFRGKGSDSVSTDWVIWFKNESRGRFLSLPPIVIDHQAKTRKRPVEVELSADQATAALEKVFTAKLATTGGAK